jgi:prepilin-type N-terminal cleavage/methylation domain-containing protein
MKLQRTKLGFTLIELLVVITIIGILATGATSVYTSQIQKARDTTRISDIKAVQSGVEQFYQDTTVYPIGIDDWTSQTSVSVMTYLPNLAEDPKHDQTCIGSRCGYIYFV